MGQTGRVKKEDGETKESFTDRFINESELGAVCDEEQSGWDGEG